MTSKKKLSLKEATQDKAQRIMNGVAAWTSFYTQNTHRSAKDFLNLRLKLFQIILLYAMNFNNYFMYLASRGQGL